MPKERVPRLPEDALRPDLEITPGVWLRHDPEGKRFVEITLSPQQAGRVLQTYLEDFPGFAEVVFWDILKESGVTAENFEASGYGVTKEFIASAVNMQIVNASLQITKMSPKAREAPAVREAYHLAIEGRVRLILEDRPAKKRFRLWR